MPPSSTTSSVHVLVPVHNYDSDGQQRTFSTKGCFTVSPTLCPPSGAPCTAAYSCHMFLRGLTDSFPHHLDGCTTIRPSPSGGGANTSTAAATKMLAMEAGLMGIFSGVYEASGAVSDTYLHHHHHGSHNQNGASRLDMSMSVGDAFVKDALHGILPHDSSTSQNTSFFSSTSFGDGVGEFGRNGEGVGTAAITGVKESAHIIASAQAFLEHHNHDNNNNHTTSPQRHHHHGSSIHIGEVPTLSIGGILLLTSTSSGDAGLSIVESTGSNPPLLVVVDDADRSGGGSLVMSQLAIATTLLSLPPGSTLPIFLDSIYSSNLEDIASVLVGVQDVLSQCGTESMALTTMMMNRNGGSRGGGHEGRDAERRRQRQIWGLSTVRSRLELWVLNPKPTDNSAGGLSAHQQLLSPLSFLCGPLVPVGSTTTTSASRRRQLYVSSGAAGCCILEGVVVVPSGEDTQPSPSSSTALAQMAMSAYAGSISGSTVPGSPVAASPPTSPRGRRGGIPSSSTARSQHQREHLPPPAKLHLVTFFTLLAEMASERDTYRWNMDYLFKQLLQFQLPTIPADSSQPSTSTATALLGNQLSTAYAVSLSYPQRLLLLAAHSLTEKAAIVSGEIAALIEGGVGGEEEEDYSRRTTSSSSPIVSRAARMSRISRLDAAMGVYSLLVDDGFGPCSVSPMFNFLSAALCVPKPRIAAPPTSSDYFTASLDDAPLYDLSEVPDASSLSSTAILNVYYAIMVRRLSWRLVMPSSESETSVAAADVVERRQRKLNVTTTEGGATSSSRVETKQQHSAQNARGESEYRTKSNVMTSPLRHVPQLQYNASSASLFAEDLLTAKREIEQLIRTQRPSGTGAADGSSTSGTYTPQSIEELISEVTSITTALFAQKDVHLSSSASASHAVSRLRARREVLLDHVLKDFIPHLYQASARNKAETSEVNQQLEFCTTKHLQQQSLLRSQLSHLKQTISSTKSQQESTVRSVLVFLEASLKAPLEDSLVDYERRIAKRRKFLLGEQFLESNNEVYSPQSRASHILSGGGMDVSQHNISANGFTFSDALRGVRPPSTNASSALSFINQSGGAPSTIAPSHRLEDDSEHFYKRQDESFTKHSTTTAAGGEEASSPIRGRKDGGGILRKDPILSLLEEFKSCCDGWLSQAVLPMVAMLHDLLDDFGDAKDPMINHQSLSVSHHHSTPSRTVSFTTEAGGDSRTTDIGGVEHLLAQLEQLLSADGNDGVGGDNLDTSSASIARLRASASKGRRVQDGSVISPSRRTIGSPHGPSTTAALALASGAVTSLIGSLDTVLMMENLEQELHAHKVESAELSHRLQVVIRERDEARRQLLTQNNSSNGAGADGGGVHSTRLEGMLQTERQERGRLMADAQHKDTKIKGLHLSLQDQQSMSSEQALEIAALREGKEQLARLAERLEYDAATSRDHYHEMESQMANNEAKYRAIKFDYERVLRELDRAEESNLQERIRVAQLLDAKGKLQAENACTNTKLQRLQGDSQRRVHRSNVAKGYNSQFETLSKSTTFTRTPEKSGGGNDGMKMLAGTSDSSFSKTHYDNTRIGASYTTTVAGIMNTSDSKSSRRGGGGSGGVVNRSMSRSHHHHLDASASHDYGHDFSSGTWEGVGEVRVPLPPIGLASYSSKAATTSSMEHNATNATLRQYAAPTSTTTTYYQHAAATIKAYNHAQAAPKEQGLDDAGTRNSQPTRDNHYYRGDDSKRDSVGGININENNISGMRMYAPPSIPLDTSSLSHRSNRSRAGSPKVIDLLPLEQLSPTNTRRHNSSVHRDEDYDGQDTDTSIFLQSTFGSPPNGTSAPHESWSRRGRAPSTESGEGHGHRRGSGLSVRSDTGVSAKRPGSTSSGPTTSELSYSIMKQHPVPKAIRIPASNANVTALSRAAVTEQSTAFARTTDHSVTDDGPQLRARPKPTIQY